MQNRVLPDNESLPDVGPPITILDALRLRSKKFNSEISGSKFWIINIFHIFRPLSSRLVFLKTVYLTLSEAVLVHFNKVFGLSLLFYLISKLISVSIGCHSFIHHIMKYSNIVLFWCFTNIPDITAMFIIFQSADYVRNQVDTNSEKSKLWIFRNFVCLGKEFFQFSGQDFDPRCHECRTQWSNNLFIEFYYWNIYFLKQSTYCWAYIDTDFHFTTKRRVYWIIRLRTFQTGEAITASGINVYRSQSGFICFLNYFLVYRLPGR